MGACDGRGRISTSSWTFEPYDTSRPEALQENLCLNIQCRCTHESCIVNCDLVSIKGHDLPPSKLSGFEDKEPMLDRAFSLTHKETSFRHLSPFT
jgi:hypothetical protein